MFTSPSGRFTPEKEAHSINWIWCWAVLRPSWKALQKENFLFPVENWKTIVWSSIT